MRRQFSEALTRLQSGSGRYRPYVVQLVGRRFVQITATPSTTSSTIEGDLQSTAPTAFGADSPDARFEVLGAPYSLLSVSLSASQNLYTRRGTLVGVSGKAENAVSTLSVLEPFRRAALGIPFLYQRISSTTPLTALISTQSPITSFTVVHLNGTVDWMIAQRDALLAWTGHNLSIRPTFNRKMSLAHWGNSQVTGRGLLALAGEGNVYQITLKPDEEYVAHPSNIVAYSITQNPPLPYRLKSSSLRLQIPYVSLGALVPDIKFVKVMRDSGFWKAVTRLYFTVRTWSRRTIWGDRLFLRFYGPTTILLQSRAPRMVDVLSSRDVSEFADTPAGAVQSAAILTTRKEEVHGSTSNNDPLAASNSPTRLSVASIGADRKVEFKDTDDFKSFSR
ncbi:MAG: Altered inheritance of mitochondria protein 24, mitochondrial [Pycnora praestabilis]|nr:MAG: Altered inheritance of mitochondria protein 24, mitochondrial [Pycnora praestabilis]